MTSFGIMKDFIGVTVIIMMSYYAAKAQTCSNCQCTVNGTCENCFNGFWGEFCSLPCSENCAEKQCEQVTGLCTNCTGADYGKNCCVDGFYDDSCDKPCPENCTSCYLLKYQNVQLTHCLKCVHGYFNPYCEPCPEHCKFGNCSQDSGNCSDGCKDGYFGNNCQYRCPGYCLNNQCQQLGQPLCLHGCQDGYYNPTCQSTCPGNCKGNKCRQDDPKCVHGCEDGYFTEYCTVDCSRASNCAFYKCNQLDGSCNEGCQDGYYGQFCKDICSSNCKYGICDQSTGKCTFGCVENVFVDELCTCPRHCNCSDKITCDNCDSGFEFESKLCECSKLDCINSTCMSCLSSQYYAYNNYCCQCSSRCKDRLCNSESECSSGCAEGYFGMNCSSLCSNNCLNESCDSENGHCTKGCKIGFWGDMCDAKCDSGCLVCNRNNGLCLACTNKTLFTQNCNESCSAGCKDHECKTESGQCTLGCILNHYGNMCDNQCSDSCGVSGNGSNCNSTNGECLFGCQDGFFGNFCKENCSIFCRNNTCDLQTGRCSDGCLDGYEDVGGVCIQVNYECLSNGTCENCKTGFYGQYCNIECPENCLGKTCDRSSGFCNNCSSLWHGENCCLDGFYRNRCDSPCPENCSSCYLLTYDYAWTPYCIGCEHGHYNPYCEQCPGYCLSGKCNFLDGTCEDKETCENGFYGSACSNMCPEQCKNKSCDRESGKCIDGCENGYLGQHCYCIGHCKNGNCSQSDGRFCFNGCEDGYYNSSCSGICPSNCYQNICDQNSSKCLLGCKDGFFSEYCTAQCSSVGNCVFDKCNWINGSCDEGCKDGFYGKFCNETCSRLCKFNICEQTTGNCTFGCVDDLYDDDTCSCPRNCNCTVNGVCDICKNQYIFVSRQCECTMTECIDAECRECLSPQFYAYNGSCCQCSNRCKDKTCLTESECSYGCEEGFYGIDCSKSCYELDINCRSCDFKSFSNNSMNCTKCRDSYFPNGSGTCVLCSEHCLNGTCDPTDGHCIHGCKDGFWGDNCNNQCHTRCLYCEISSGDCLACENKNMFSYNCNQPCSTNCVNQECHAKTGHCVKSCTNDHFGKTCEHNCSNTCKIGESGSKCASENGQCRFGCMDGFYGYFCEQSCNFLCMGKTCDRITGYCTAGCSNGYTEENRTCIKVVHVSDASVNTSTVIIAVSAGSALLLVIITCVIVWRCWVASRARPTRHGGENDRRPDPKIKENAFVESDGYDYLTDIGPKQKQGTQPNVNSEYSYVSQSQIGKYNNVGKEQQYEQLGNRTDGLRPYEHLGRARRH